MKLTYIISFLLLVSISFVSAFNFPSDELTINTYTGNLTNLSQLADTNIPTPTDNYVLSWDSATNKWIAVSQSSVSDTNETTRINALALTDCPAGYLVIGVQSNGTVLCVADAGNSSFNQSLTDGLYAILGYGDDWNKTYADGLYADISVTGGNASWNETYADTLYSNETDTNETSFVNNLTTTDCTAGNLVIGVQANGTVLCAVDAGNASWTQAVASGLYYDLGNSYGYWNDTYATFNKTYADTLYSNDTDSNETSFVNNLTLTDCTAGNLVIGVQDNGTVLCATDAGNASWTQAVASGLYISQSEEGNLDVNSSDYWDNYNTANTTQFENNGGRLDIILSWLTGFINSLIGNPFDQSLNTTDNVTFNRVNASDWTNVSIIQTQISDLVHTTDTNVTTACSTSEVLLGNGTCFNSTLFYDGAGNGSWTQAVATGLYYDLGNSYGYYNSTNPQSFTDTNASTGCSTSEVLLGNGTCFNSTLFYDGAGNGSWTQAVASGLYYDLGNSYGYYNSTNPQSFTDTNASTGCSVTEVLLGNGTCYNSTLFYDGAGNGSWTQAVADGLYIKNNTASWELNITRLWTTMFHTLTSDFEWTVTDDGSNMFMDFSEIGGQDSLFIETAGTFIEMIANPGPANDYEMIAFEETQGADTSINFYEGGTGHNRIWSSGSVRIGGEKESVCSNLTSDVDCDTSGTGADLVVQDDGWFGGTLFSSNWSNVSIIQTQISDFTPITDTNASTGCSTSEVLLGNGTCFDSDFFYDGSGGNASWTQAVADGLYYDLGNSYGYWNDTYATFNETYADGLYYDLGNSYGYYNSTNPQSFTDTNASTGCSVTEVLLGNGTCFNSTLFYDGAGNGSWTQAVASGLYYDLGNSYGYYNSTNPQSFTDTNASTACSTSEVLLGNGTCFNSTLFYDGAGNASWTQAVASGLYYDLGNSYGYWNDTYATFNKTYADGLYSNTTDTNETSFVNNLTLTDCTAGNLVIGVQDNGTVLCATDAGNASWTQAVANGLYYDLGNSYGYWNDTYATFNKTYADTLYSNTTDTNETSFVNNLTLTDCTAGNLVIGVQTNGTVLCVADAGNASFNESYTDGIYILQSEEGNLDVNSSDYWDNYNTANSTQFENNGGRLDIILSWLTGFINNLISNPFDQSLNTTDNVTFNRVNASDWTNVSITQSQISDFAPITDTNASTACSTSEVLLGNGTCFNSTLFYDGAGNGSWTQAVASGLYVNIDGDTMTGNLVLSQKLLIGRSSSSLSSKMIEINNTGNTALRMDTVSNDNIFLEMTNDNGNNYLIAGIEGSAGGYLFTNTLPNDAVFGTYTTDTIKFIPNDVVTMTLKDSGTVVNVSGNTYIDGDANITGLYYGNGSQLTDITGDNSSWSQSVANGLYAILGYGDNWNKTYADVLYAPIDVPASTVDAGTFGTGNYVMDTNLTVEALVFETDSSHYMEDNSTCIIIYGDTSILEIC